MNNEKKGIKKRRKRGILVKIIFGGTQSMWSYSAGTWSTAGTSAKSGLHSWYLAYNGDLLAGTWSTDSINVNKGLWLVRKQSGRL